MCRIMSHVDDLGRLVGRLQCRITRREGSWSLCWSRLECRLVGRDMRLLDGLVGRLRGRNLVNEVSSESFGP